MTPEEARFSRLYGVNPRVQVYYDPQFMAHTVIVDIPSNYRKAVDNAADYFIVDGDSPLASFKIEETPPLRIKFHMTDYTLVYAYEAKSLVVSQLKDRQEVINSPYDPDDLATLIVDSIVYTNNVASRAQLLPTTSRPLRPQRPEPVVRNMYGPVKTALNWFKQRS